MRRSRLLFALLAFSSECSAYWKPVETDGPNQDASSAPPPCNTSGALDVGWLACRTAQVIEGCKLRGVDATVIFTPDASHGYGAQWTRDFYYTVSSASDSMKEDEVKMAVNYTFLRQRSDGCMPDRVQTDGKGVMAPGPFPHPKPHPDHAWDNGPFAVLLLAATVEAWPDSQIFFCKLEPAARSALDFVNRSANGLVFNDVLWPNFTYGFTDTIAKTGNLLFTSLLYIDASKRMAALSQKYKCGNHRQYSREAIAVSASIDVMHDPHGPLWLAATVDNAFPDVWGSAYLVALGLSTRSRRNAAMAEMVAHKWKYFHGGQVRSLPAPMHWNRCCFTPHCGEVSGTIGCPANGTYQNGAYWATPLTYVTRALIATNHTEFARELVEACIKDFQTNGIYEDVGFEANLSRGVLNYTASATNTLLAALLLDKEMEAEVLVV